MRNKTLVRVGVLAVILILSACGTGQSAPPAEQAPAVEDSPFVIPMPADSAEMAVAGPGGALPCGGGQVGWGHRVFRMADFPTCQADFPNLTVYCLDAEATWSNANVADVVASPGDNTVAFESMQEGICALFPAGG